MSPYKQWIAFSTIVRKGIVRVFRIWSQTLLPSVITSVLYFAVFGSILGSRIGDFNGVPYILFVVPGLVMLAVVTNAFSDVATTFFTAKFFSRSIDEILVSPTPPWIIIAGFVGSGVVRGVMIGALVLVVSLFFTHLTIHSLLAIIGFLVLTSLVFALGGLINGIYAKNFDGITIIPTFVLTPLVYLGGVFYSVQALPSFWQNLTFLNPIFYIVNGFRYGFLGFADVSVGLCVAVLCGLAAILIAANWYMLRTGLGLRQ